MDQSNLSKTLMGLLNEERDVRFSKGDTIFKEGSPVKHIFFIKNGLIKLVKEKTNGEFIISLVKSPSFFGFSSAYVTQRYYLSAYALNECLVNFIEIENFKLTIRSDGAFAEKFIEMGLAVEMEIMNRMVSLSGKQLPGKLADTLIYFVNKLFDDYSFQLPLSRQDLANYIGVSLKSFNSTLKDFDNDGIISLKKNFITIEKMDVLLKLSRKG